MFLPAVSGEVIVCDTSPARALLIRDVGRHQGAGVESYVANRVSVHTHRMIMCRQDALNPVKPEMPCLFDDRIVTHSIVKKHY